jgi:hypothetical protein
MECTMIRKSQAASLLTLALVVGMSAPAQALATLPLDQVDRAPQAVIAGSTATVSNVTNLLSTGAANFDDVYEGWFACDGMTSSEFTGPTIHSLLTSNSTLVGFAFTPPDESDTLNCRSLGTTASSIDLSLANVWDSTSSAFVAYSTGVADFPHIAYFGAYVAKGQVPATSNMRLVTPRTRHYFPPTPDTLAPTVSGALLASNGTTLTITFNEDMKAATAPTGFQVIKSAMPQALTAGNITQAGRTLVLTLTTPMLQSDVLQLWYAQPGNGVEDVAGNDLASFGGPNGAPVAITNNSSQTGQVQGGVPSTTTNPSFSLVGNSVTNVQNPTWTGVSGFTVTHYVVACTQQKTSVLTAVSPNTPATQFCRPLYTDNTATSNATNLLTAVASVSSGGSLTYVAYDPLVHGGYIALVSIANSMSGPNTSYGVSTATQTYVDSASLAPAVVTTPYTGPIVTPPAAVSFRPGGKAVLPGSNLSGVSKVSVAGLDADAKINSAGELEITVPSSLKPGVYDLVIVSDSGTLTVQDGLRVAAGSSSVGATSEARPSTKLKEDNTVKVWVFDVVDAGKVQIFHNGKEIAWVNTTDSSDSKLTSGFLVRTVDLAPVKNVIEVYVDGVRVDRKGYSN